MSKKEIEIRIDKKGKITVESFGFKGMGCEESIKLLTQGLGKIVSSTNKSEYGDIQNVEINQDI